MALGMVRAAQGRDEEADALLTEALEILRPTQLTDALVGILQRYATFLRERGRADEAAAYEEEADGLRPTSVLA
jgi:tetratricopeptide (TPR) repeat protein